MGKNVLAVLIGGAIGSLFRYGINLGTLGFSFPVGTLFENIIGSFLLGVLTGWFIFLKPKEWIKAGLGAGLCGGFTTMSALAGDVFLLTSHSTLLLTVLYLFFSIIGGLISAFIGIIAGRTLAEKRLQEGQAGGIK
jgi:CrcB protein